jgi:hypothetical protein
MDCGERTHAARSDPLGGGYGTTSPGISALLQRSLPLLSTQSSTSQGWIFCGPWLPAGPADSVHAQEGLSRGGAPTLLLPLFPLRLYTLTRSMSLPTLSNDFS